ncbi:hypothetical protein [Streptomyces sp. NPDC005012]|uniref:hypothetical protein n=1 Tax=Streptomyces sp. NPDC005012 TaxID=3154558 RepID=UPI0033A9EFF9
MSKSDIRRIDRQVEQTARKLEAVREREMWPLTRRELSSVMAGLAGGVYSVSKGRTPSRAERRLEAAWGAAEIRLTTEMTALQMERQRLVTEAAKAKKAGRQSIWW